MGTELYVPSFTTPPWPSKAGSGRPTNAQDSGEYRMFCRYFLFGFPRNTTVPLLAGAVSTFFSDPETMMAGANTSVTFPAPSATASCVSVNTCGNVWTICVFSGSRALSSRMNCEPSVKVDEKVAASQTRLLPLWPAPFTRTPVVLPEPLVCVAILGDPYILATPAN